MLTDEELVVEGRLLTEVLSSVESTSEKYQGNKVLANTSIS